MRPAHAYFGIGIVMILAVVAFINPEFIRHTDDTKRGTLDTPDAASFMNFTLSSTAFAEGSGIPPQYTCDASQASPPLSISGAPEGTKAFALIMEDPDVPKQIKPDGVFLHWLLFNIPGSITEITEDAEIGVSGENGAGKNGYIGPCSPPQYEPSTHRYIFTLYALDTMLTLGPGAKKADVLKAMKGHILGEATLSGTYSRK